MQQLPLAIGPDAAREFANFVVGVNAQAVDHLRAADLLAAPVYLWGPRGCGKTHLLSAAAHRVRAAGGWVQWLGAGGVSPEPAAGDADGPGCRLLVIDDCDGLDAERQQQAFSLLARSTTRPAAVLAAGRRPLIDLPLRADLRSRLAQGLVFALVPLDESGARRALEAEAHRRGLTLPPEVSHYLLTHFDRDLASLMGLLERLDHYALVHKRAPTVPLLKQMIDDTPPLP